VSVQLTDFPTPAPEWRDADLASRWEEVLTVRDEVNKALEEAKASGTVEKPLAAKVTLTASPDRYAVLAPYREQLAGLFIVSQAELQAGAPDTPLTVHVAPAHGNRCDRCWLVLPTVGQSAAHPSLCHRCVEAIEEQAGARR
jgi:isoleucyl-tRNA synthetase